MNGVKRYDPVNSDGTCGMCVEDADYGAYVEYADYAALEAELKKVKADRSACWAEFKVMTRSCLDAELVRQCIAQEMATWEGDFKGPVHTAMRCLQVRLSLIHI